ncbi:MAG: peptide deformylase [Patescibacteria group bacterium]
MKILTIPNPILRQKSQEIKDISNPEIQKLIPKMIQTMQANKGIGLACPQVGKSIRLIIIATKNGAIPFINPKILWHSKKEEIDEEGCLSLPKIYGLVKRWQEVKIEAFDINGKKEKIKAQGLFARVLQHEIDHLDGVLFIDRLIKQTSGAKINFKK